MAVHHVVLSSFPLDSGRVHTQSPCPALIAHVVVFVEQNERKCSNKAELH